MTMASGSSSRFYYAQYLCEQWNERHIYRDFIWQVHMYFMLEATQPPHRLTQVEEEPMWLGTYDCFPNHGGE